MKTAALIARCLLGFVFFVFGLNGFLHFIPVPPPKEPVAGQFLGALFLSHYLVLIFVLQIVPGVLLLATSTGTRNVEPNTNLRVQGLTHHQPAGEAEAV